jgi:hypothetical protein
MNIDKTGREIRLWWAVHEGAVVRTKGYSCAPANPKSWWCPGIGFTMTEGFHLFKNKTRAVQRAIAELKFEKRSLEKKLAALKEMLPK